MPLVEQLRRQTDLLRGSDHLRAVAQSLSAIAERSASVPELTMLAARAWLAAGEQGYARHFAKQIVENTSAPDDVRIAALEVLESTPTTDETVRPPPVAPLAGPLIVLEPAVDRRAPPGASLPPTSPDASGDGDELPPVLVAPSPPPRAEIVETLPLPKGLQEDLLAAGVIPRDPLEARVAMTRLARRLGRDYRLWYGTTLKTDLAAIDAMQNHLRRRFADGVLDEKRSRQLEVELTRHGALLSEILARTLGAQWLEVSSEQPGHWSMLVPPGVRIWPIGRVYRFFGQGHREADLVAYYTDLETRARAPRR
jgi:hypothetical protein